MMNEDTKNYSAEQMSRELQKLGSSINVSSSLDGITFQVQSLKKNVDATLKLLEERIFRPKFTEEAFSRIKKQTVEGFKIAKNTTGHSGQRRVCKSELWRQTHTRRSRRW